VGTGKAKDEPAPLSEIIEVLNERFGTQFSEEDRLFFQQIKEKACKSEQVVRTAMANPLDKFELGIRKLIEEMMIERMTENDEDRHALHGGSGVSGRSIPYPGARDFRGREVEGSFRR
jgi:type I restriction enzyme R subunit